MKVWLSLVLLFSPAIAFARAGTGAANAEYANPKSLKGLCTQENKGESFYDTGLCLSIKEQLTDNECTKKIVEELRVRVKGDENDPAFKKLKAQGKGAINSMLRCEGDKPGQNMSKIAMSKESFDFYLEQLIAMATVKTSGWDVLKDEQAGSKGPGGLLNLSLDKGGVTDMENKDATCGCKKDVATTSGQSGVTVEGPSPGPLDGHHSMTCGSYMILNQIAKDGDLAGGQNSTPRPGAAANQSRTPAANSTPRRDRDTRIGAAKIVSSFEDEQDPGADNSNARWYNRKMDTFCKRYWKSPNSQVNEWDDQIRQSSDAGTNSSQ